MNVAVFEDDAQAAESLAADLASGDTDRRILAVQRAGREGGARSIEPLAKALRDAEPRVRTGAAESLAELAERAAEYGDPPPDALASALAPLREAAQDSVPEVRRAAVGALALCDDDESALAFERALTDENAGVRIEAVRGLWRIGGADAARAICAKLDDEDGLVRYYALSAVDELEPPGFLEAIARKLTDPRSEVAAEAAFLLAERGDRRATPVLCRTLAHRDLGFEAARLLGQLGDGSAGEGLRRFVGRFFADPLTRARAWGSLWRLGDADAEAWLCRALSSWRRPVRGLAIEILSEGGSARAFDAILATARNTRDYHCSTAARALGRYGDPRATDVLCALATGHADRDVREDAAWALGELPGDEPRRALAKVAESDSDDGVREAARRALDANRAGPSSQGV